MASYTISPIWGAGAQLFNNSGAPLTGGKIYTYLAGTTTPATTYTTPTGLVANTNPIVADASGRLTNEIWFPYGPAYKFVLKDANDTLLATYDNIPCLPQPPITNDASSISYQQGYEVDAGNFTVGADYLITSVGNTDFVAIGAAGNVVGVLFTATGIGSGTGKALFSRTVQAKLRESVSVKDFGAVGDGVTDDTAAIQAAVTAAENGSLYFPAGTYLVNTAILLPSNVFIFGDGDQSVIKSTTLDNNGTYAGQNQFVASGKTNIQIQNLKFDTSEITVFTASIRCIYIYDCSYYSVNNCTFVTCGAAVASLNSDNYTIENNTAIIESTDGAAHHDGVFDNWWGCSYFKIIGNSVIGNSIARYAYLVTGVTSSLTAAKCSYFDISNNSAKDIKYIGIWSQGNLGTNTNFTISNNRIQTVNEFFGIRISDSAYFTLNSNVIDTTYYSGITFTTESGTTYGAQYGSVVGNVVSNSNTGLAAGGTGAAINITNTSSNIHLESTIITGTTHTYPVILGASTANNYVGSGQYAAGTSSPYPYNGGAATNILLNGSYTPTLTNVSNVTSSTPTQCLWTRNGNYVTVTGQIDVTPTANTLTKVGISLPIASNFTSLIDCSGVCATNVAAGFVIGDATNDRADLQWTTASSGTVNVVAFTFTYQVK